MRECFRSKRFGDAALALIDRCNAIVRQYSAQGLRLTLRQLYYQLVSANVIPNEEKSYKNLGALVSDARLAGKIDWDAIEDRVRRPRNPAEFSDIAALVEAALGVYRLPRWEGQAAYVELWVEKDALAGVLEPLANEFHATMMVNRGYSSSSAMYESAGRFKDAQNAGKRLILLYLGDHDPSGEDMVRDVGDRLALFGVEDLDVRKLALTMEQIKRYKPPPNPAKMSDSRAAAYVAEHGHSSWEVDALPPNVLQKIIRDAFRAEVDESLMTAVKVREGLDKERLRAAVKGIMEG